MTISVPPSSGVSELCIKKILVYFGVWHKHIHFFVHVMLMQKTLKQFMYFKLKTWLSQFQAMLNSQSWLACRCYLLNSFSSTTVIPAVIKLTVLIHLTLNSLVSIVMCHIILNRFLTTSCYLPKKSRLMRFVFFFFQDINEGVSSFTPLWFLRKCIYFISQEGLEKKQP